jgi:hypothetical protein
MIGGVRAAPPGTVSLSLSPGHGHGGRLTVTVTVIVTALRLTVDTVTARLPRYMSTAEGRAASIRAAHAASVPCVPLRSTIGRWRTTTLAPITSVDKRAALACMDVDQAADGALKAGGQSEQSDVTCFES